MKLHFLEVDQAQDKKKTTSTKIDPVIAKTNCILRRPKSSGI